MDNVFHINWSRLCVWRISDTVDHKPLGAFNSQCEVTYPGLAGHGWMVHLLTTKCPALVESDEKFIVVAARAIYIDTVWVMHIARAVNQSSKGAVETNDHFHVFV